MIQIAKHQKKVRRDGHLVFEAYLPERNIQNPATTEELVTVLRSSYA